jgi:predicted O-methyltransferase YrrM
MRLHPLVEEILQSGKVATDDGRVVKAHSHIPRDECELLYRQVAATRATEAIEVGMAFGISTLCLCDALSRNTPRETGKRPHLVVMDPHQHLEGWKGLGLQQVRSAGFGDLVEFHERTSQVVLAELAAKGYRVQFAFVDGWHTFDHTLIDFFYVDQVMENGGVIVFDDVGYPAVNAVLRFVLANRDYELVEVLKYPRTGLVNRGKRLVKGLLRRRLARTDQDPTEAHQHLFRGLEFAHAAALRKVAPDTRKWDHYCAF